MSATIRLHDPAPEWQSYIRLATYDLIVEKSGKDAALAWINGMPMYAQIGWAMGVWLALLGSILLLIRSRWAVWSFGLSLVGAILSLGYQLTLAPPMPGAENSPMMKVMPAVILLIAVALFLYARAMEKKGVLR